MYVLGCFLRVRWKLCLMILLGCFGVWCRVCVFGLMVMLWNLLRCCCRCCLVVFGVLLLVLLSVFC